MKSEEIQAIYRFPSFIVCVIAAFGSETLTVRQRQVPKIRPYIQNVAPNYGFICIEDEFGVQK